MGKGKTANRQGKPSSLLEQALVAQRERQWDKAAGLYQRHLGRFSNDVAALGNLATVQRHLGRGRDALANFSRAIRLDPGRWDIWFNQANAQKAMGLSDMAEDSYRQAVTLNHGFHQGWFNLGILLRDQGRWEDAVGCYTTARDLQPDSPSYHFQLGQALARSEREDEAADAFSKVLSLEPGHPGAALALAQLLRRMRRDQEAEAVVEQALAKHPQERQLARFLAVLLLETDRAEKALALLRRVRQVLPEDLGLMSDEGVALQKLGRMEEAEAIWRMAAAKPSPIPDPLCNLGALYLLQNKFERAVAVLEQALALDPDHMQANANLADIMIRTGRPSRVLPLAQKLIAAQPNSGQGYLVLGNALTSQARISEALQAFKLAHRHSPHDRIPVANSLFSLLYSDRHGPREIADTHQSLAATIKPAVPDWAGPRRDPDRDPHRPIRVGYLSTDFGEHPVGYLMRPILEHHDPRRVTAICYADVAQLDATGRELRSLAGHWVDCHGWPDQTLVGKILEGEIDILVDLNGHTAGGRTAVTASHPAHITAVFLGYPYAMGLPGLDWFLADQYIVPADKAHLYPDKVESIPRCIFNFKPYPDSPPVAPPPALQRGHVTFGSFNNLPKLSDSTVELWTEVMHRVPGSRLILKALQFQDEETRRLIAAKFERHGLDISRLELRGPSRPLMAYLAGYAEVDLALDPLPFNGGMTTLDALWMGVPVISLAGELSFGRMGHSILSTAGLTQWVATTKEEYIAIAVDLAGNPSRLAEARAQMRARLLASPLCDGAGYVRELEEVYARMWKETRPRG